MNDKSIKIKTKNKKRKDAKNYAVFLFVWRMYILFSPVKKLSLQ